MLPRRFYIDSFFDHLTDSESVLDVKCDVYEKDGLYHIEADIPGVKKEDISVECNDGYLTITAEKKEEQEENSKNYIRKERVYGKIKRQFYVGKVDDSQIEAEFINGMLKISVPREEMRETKKIIEIK